MNKEVVRTKIMRFMSVLHHCLEQTEYLEDKQLYEKDIVFVSRWLVSLEGTDDPIQVVNAVLDSSSSKFILDYFKRGECGDLEATAFANLQRELVSEK